MMFFIAFVPIAQVLAILLDFDYAWHSQLKYFEVILIPAHRITKADKVRMKFKYPFNGNGEAFIQEIGKNWIDKRIQKAALSPGSLSGFNFNELTTLIYRAMIKRGHLLISYKVNRNEDGKYCIHLTPEICPMTPGEYECLEYERTLAQRELEQKRIIGIKLVEFFEQCHPKVVVNSELGILTGNLPISLNDFIDLIAQTEMIIKKLSFKAAEHYVDTARGLKEKCDKIKTDTGSLDFCLEYTRILPEIPSTMISNDTYKRITSFIANIET